MSIGLFWSALVGISDLLMLSKLRCALCCRTSSEKRLLIIRNLQSEKTIVNKQEEFYLSKESVLLKRKYFLISRNFLPLQKENFFWQAKLFLFIDNLLLTLQIPDYQQAFFWAYRSSWSGWRECEGPRWIPRISRRSAGVKITNQR